MEGITVTVSVDRSNSHSAISEDFYHKFLHILHPINNTSDLVGFEVDLENETIPLQLDPYSEKLIKIMTNRLRHGFAHDYMVHTCQTLNKDVYGPISKKRCHGTVYTEVSFNGKKKNFVLFRIDTVRKNNLAEPRFDMLIGKDVFDYFRIKAKA